MPGSASAIDLARFQKSAARGGTAAAAPSLLQPGHNVWRVEQADRAAVLADGANFFHAVRAALMQAQRSIFIVGWDIDSRTRLVGDDCEPNDGMPVTIAEFLSAMVEKRPELTVHLLLWDYSLVYALERELFPTLALHWSTPRQVRLCLDDELPLGSSHHQKVIVVDDAVAFSGGLDLTVRRWDTSDHALDNPQRVDPSGKAYRPFHDVQALVDGAAARALGELVRARWCRASGDGLDEVAPIGDPWPAHVRPDFRDIRVGIARTLPEYDGRPEVREVEALFLDMIDAARDTIYVENQFLTCSHVGERLAKAMQRNRGLEALLVAPKQYDSWIESVTMRHGRIRLKRMLDKAGVADRVHLLYPDIRDGGQATSTMVHSKVMTVDDRWLRVGSANLNNRSMGVDSECDLVFEARDAKQRQAIRAVRDRLIGEHCGVDGDAIAEAIRRTGSLLRAVERTSANGHSLRAIDDGELRDDIGSTLEEVADPHQPLTSDVVIDRQGTRLSTMQLSTIAKVALAAVLILALPLTWRYTPLATLANPSVVRATLATIAASSWAPLLVVGVFVAAGLVAFPVVVLIAVTAATFGPFLGLVYAALGALVSAVVGYLIGAWLGKDMLRDWLGPRLDRIRARIVKRGVLTVAAVRVVPIAPFTLVNLVAGASQIRLQDFVAGTALGLAPGLIVMSAMGHQVFQMLTQPTFGNVAALGAAIVGWIVVSIGVQVLLSKLRRTEP